MEIVIPSAPSKIPCTLRSPLRECVIMREISFEASQRDVRKYDFTCISRYCHFYRRLQSAGEVLSSDTSTIIIQRNYDVHEANLEPRPPL